MSRFALSLPALLLLTGAGFHHGGNLFGPVSVDAHGLMTSPRSRNWVAAQDGYVGWDGGQAGVPPKETCQHCLNNNEGVCGKVSNGGRSYDPFLDSMGQEMPWTSQATYAEGQVIEVLSYLDTHHNGHMTLSACPMGKASTQECFDNPDHFLHFVADPKFGMPADPNYPERGMYWGGQGGGEKSFQMLFKLPEGVGIHGDQVMLQWKYITANSCSPPGYAEYFAANPDLPNSFWTQGVTQCTPPYPSDGTRSTTWPEQFFNCAEVTINALAPTPPPPPTPAPPPTEAVPTATAPSPTAPSPTTTAGGPGCCSRDFKNCNEQLVGWCSESQANCEGPCGKYWLADGAITGGCTARYEACSTDADCCSPGVCTGGMCEAVDPTNISGPTSPTSPTSPTGPTGPSPTPPSSGTTCCTQKFHQCETWCGTTEAECLNCPNANDMVWATIEVGTSCTARFEDCTGSAGSQGPCCSGLQCVGDQYYASCQYVEPPAPAPTTTTTTTVPAPTTTTTVTVGPPVANSCYSFNYKDCNHPDVPGDMGCSAVLLPFGAESGCLAKFDECTGQSDDVCCLDLVCHGDATFAQCLEPSVQTPARRKVMANDASAAGGACIVCDDVAARDMTDRGIDCTSVNALDVMCTKDRNWLMNRFCRRSCFEAGFAYEGDVCCTAGGATSRLLRKNS